MTREAMESTLVSSKDDLYPHISGIFHQYLALDPKTIVCAQSHTAYLAIIFVPG